MSPTSGALSRDVLIAEGTFLHSCIWSVTVSSGRRLRVLLYRYKGADDGNEDSDTSQGQGSLVSDPLGSNRHNQCSWKVLFEEANNNDVKVPLCYNNQGDRLIQAFQSTTTSVNMFFSGKSLDSMPNFMLKYEGNLLIIKHRNIKLSFSGLLLKSLNSSKFTFRFWDHKPKCKAVIAKIFSCNHKNPRTKCGKYEREHLRLRNIYACEVTSD